MVIYIAIGLVVLFGAIGVVWGLLDARGTTSRSDWSNYDSWFNG